MITRRGFLKGLAAAVGVAATARLASEAVADEVKEVKGAVQGGFLVPTDFAEEVLRSYGEPGHDEPGFFKIERDRATIFGCKITNGTVVLEEGMHVTNCLFEWDSDNPGMKIEALSKDEEEEMWSWSDSV